MKTKNNISRIALIVSIAVPFIMASCSSFDPEPVGLAFNYDHVDDFSFGAGAGTVVPYLHVDSLIRYDSTSHTLWMNFSLFGIDVTILRDFKVTYWKSGASESVFHTKSVVASDTVDFGKIMPKSFLFSTIIDSLSAGESYQFCVTRKFTWKNRTALDSVVSCSTLRIP